MFLKTLLKLCLLRANPQDLPTSNALTLLALAANGAMDVLGVSDSVPPARALTAAAVDTLMLVAATHLALHWRRFENRFSQTVTALAGSGAVLSLVAWVGAGLASETVLPAWTWAPLLMWYTVVFGHVLRHALAIPMVAGVAASFLYVALSLSVTGLFVVEPAH